MMGASVGRVQIIPALLMLAFAFAATGANAAEQKAVERKAVCEALGKVFDNPRLQRSLPSSRPTPALKSGPLAVCDVVKKKPPPPRVRKRGGLSAEQTMPVMRLAIWLLIVTLLGMMLIPLISGGGLRVIRRKGRPPILRTELEIDQALAEARLHSDPAAAALSLAEEGLLVEAVRLLVGAAIERLRFAGRRIKSDATNREILRSLHQDQAIARPFGAIVRLEERALFRAEAIDDADVLNCIASFTELETRLKSAPDKEAA